MDGVGRDGDRKQAILFRLITSGKEEGTDHQDHFLYGEETFVFESARQDEYFRVIMKIFGEVCTGGRG